jgi:hypothetical protein
MKHDTRLHRRQYWAHHIRIIHRMAIEQKHEAMDPQSKPEWRTYAASEAVRLWSDAKTWTRLAQSATR